MSVGPELLPEVDRSRATLASGEGCRGSGATGP